jgi:hypothetical protein
VFTKDGIHTLGNVVMVDPKQKYLFPQSCATQEFVAFDVVQIKKKNYHDRHPTDQFLPLTIEIFKCPHKQVDVFLHDCANAIWSLKEPKGLHLSILVTFFNQNISITLPKV